MPRIYSGIYGLGSRDFRPEDILGAYEYTQGKIKRQDSKHKRDGESYTEALSLKGNKNPDRDRWQAKMSETKETYDYTIAHWCATEARLRLQLPPLLKNRKARFESD